MAHPSCMMLHQHPHYNYTHEPDPRKHEYLIGISDILRITVWKNPELATEARVRPDGTITMPLLGDVHVASKPPSQVKQEVADKLATYIKDETAVVTIAVAEVNSYRFTVSGSVEHPGEFASRHYITLSEALALAGGPTKFASPEDVIVVRTDPSGRVRRIPVDYTDIRSGEHPEENLVIIPGDNVFVPLEGSPD